jgi:hypothetical protein
MKSTTIKKSFYIDREIDKILTKASPKKMSERANELMKKGLLKEREEEMALEYQRLGELAPQPVPTKNTISSTSLAYRLFDDDDSDDGELV